MSPPLPVTEDTPPDMLAGAMDLHVVLPNGRDIKMSVERSTPMMDLLVQVTTANKISPGGHVIQAIGDRGILPYKPSTPIGALDTWTVHIVSKKQATTANSYIRKSSLPPKPANQNTPFEQTFRLQVNLPRNQLYVSRVSYKTRLQDVLREVCVEKNLDQCKYSFFHPEKPEEELDLSKTFNEYKLQRVSLASKSNRPVGLSSVDIMALKRYENGNQHVNNKYYASHSYDGSVSSGSIEGRSLSPVRSDESSSSPTISKPNNLLNRPSRKRRPAPKPPSSRNEQDCKHPSESLTISHSRNSSDSSGYHESSVLSESPESNTNSLANSLPRRSKLPSEDPYHGERGRAKTNLPSGVSKVGNSLSRSLSNLAVIGNRKPNVLTRGMRHKEYSASSTSLCAIPGKKKKAPAPPPPKTSKSLLSLKEEEVPDDDLPPPAFIRDNETTQKTLSLPATRISCHQPGQVRSSPRPRVEPSKTSQTDVCSRAGPVDNRIQSAHNSHVDVDVVDSAVLPAANIPDTGLVKIDPHPSSRLKEKELTMDDEEIDRIFNDATKDYESTPVLPSPVVSTSASPITTTPATGIRRMTRNQNNELDSYNWQYKLPSPPKAFRDQQTGSPSVTEYDTVSISNLTANVMGDRRSASREATDSIADDVKSNVPKKEYCGTAKSESRSNLDEKLKTKAINPGHPADSTTALLISSDRSRSKKDDAVVDLKQHNQHRRSDPQVEEPVVPVTLYSQPMRNDSRIFEEMDERRSTFSCEGYMDANYGSTNDSGLGSDDSIPSVSESKNALHQPLDEATTYIKAPVLVEVADRRTSTLQNFTISTYQNSKPTEIFHDDSVKTSKTTQMAKSNRAFASSLGDEKAAHSKSSLGLSRHSSFSTERSPNSMVKRSTSHISLLSGNFTKFNRLGKLNGTGLRSYADNAFPERDMAATCNLTNGNNDVEDDDAQPTTTWQNPREMATTAAVSRLRRTTSELSMNKDCNKDEDELLELRDQFVKRTTANASHSKSNVQLQSVQVLKDILPQINRSHSRDNLVAETVTSRTVCPTRASTAANRPEVERKAHSVAYQPPEVNIQSWNERPKRQVSIKTDSQYVFSNGHASNTDSAHSRQTDETNAQTRFHSGTWEDLSRVPIVRAVEFKKPYSWQAKAAESRPSAPPTSTTAVIDDESRSVERATNYVEPKQRPASFYLFGEHVSTDRPPHKGGEKSLYRSNSQLEISSAKGGSTFDNQAGGQQRDGHNSLTHNKLRNSHEVTDASKEDARRSSCWNGDRPVQDSRQRAENYTFKLYKNKLMENEKSSSRFGCAQQRRYDQQEAATTNGNGHHFATNTPKQENSFDQRKPMLGSTFSQQRDDHLAVLQELKGKTCMRIASCIPAAPPMLGPASRSCNQGVIRSRKSLAAEDPRDTLLSSIKNFNRDNLRKLRIK